jgi:hypothetical protein
MRYRPIGKPVRPYRRICEGCGRKFACNRYNVVVCGDRCGLICRRGGALAYIDKLPAYLQMARRFNHQSQRDDIGEIEANRRVLRKLRADSRNRPPPVFLKANPDPPPEEPPARPGGGKFITV